MGFADKINRAADKVADLIGPVGDQTVVDDARSRLARKDQMERERIQRVEYDEDGTELLWFDVAITVGDHSGVPMPWPGKSWEDVNNAVIEWLNTADFRTVDFVNNGAKSKLTFRTSFVSHWAIGAGRRRR